jgi:hypothetical protein
VTPDVYGDEALRFRAKAAAVVNDPELKAVYLGVAEAYEALTGKAPRTLEGMNAQGAPPSS